MPVLRISLPEEKGCYVALSYCWGGPQELITTTATLQSRINGLPLESLPKTIYDAIILTRSLHFEYLWVDALCIIQDSQADKILEINSMGSVYKNATLTIAAANSLSVKDGFLFKATPRYHCRLPFLMPSSKVGTINCIWRGPSGGYPNPLDSRGWAYQEDVLSQRILYFDREGLSWKCQSEYSGLIFEQPHATGTRLPSIIFTGNNHSPATPTSTLAKVWAGIICHYSAKVFTFPKDRLPALAGIAGELQILLGPEATYLAGLWKCWLIRHLGWYNPASLKPSQLTETTFQDYNQRQSPTWSWVSLNSGFLIDEILEERAEYISCTTELVTEGAPLGEVRGGRLILRALLTPHQESPFGKVEVRMDNPQDSVNIEVMVYLYLGIADMNVAIGLVLQPIGDGNFLRVGQIQSKFKFDVCSDLLEPRVITII